MDELSATPRARPIEAADAHDRDDPGINMTPMIDVVFQLLIFFMLTLRFRSVDRRIESEMPNTIGTRPEIASEPPPTLIVKLFRKDAEKGARAFTRVRVANRHTIDLPPFDAEADPAGGETRESALDRVIAALDDVRRRGGYDPDVEGEIRTPLPEGMAVPHADVVAVLDAFLRAEFGEVRFAGAPMPLPGR